MSVSLWLCLAFSVGFTFESIFGFGGGIVAYSILAFLFDIKSVVLVGLYVGTISSFVVFATSIKYIDYKLIKNNLLYIFAGVIVGALFFKFLPSKILIRIYSISLMLIALRALLFANFIVNSRLAKYIFGFGGVIQGALGIGGPFLALGLKSQNVNKTVFRASLSAIFCIVNIYRYIQLSLTGAMPWNFFTKFWFVPIPVMFSLWIGYQFHKKIPQHKFDRHIYIGILVSSIAFLVLF